MTASPVRAEIDLSVDVTLTGSFRPASEIEGEGMETASERELTAVW